MPAARLNVAQLNVDRLNAVNVPHARANQGEALRSTEIIRLLKADGWFETRQRGSHIHFRHPNKPGLVIVPFHGGRELAKGTEEAILKQAGLR